VAYEADQGLSYGDLEALASHVREALDISPTTALPVMSLFEQLDKIEITVDGRDISLNYAVEEQEREGQSYYDSKRQCIMVTLSDDTYEGIEQGRPRASFTAAHEIGHPLCHPKLLMSLPYMPHEMMTLMRGSANHPKFRDTEWQANGFAAALLAPAEALAALEREGRLRPGELVVGFNMSRQCAEYRVDNYRRFRAALLAGAARGKRMV